MIVELTEVGGQNGRSYFTAYVTFFFKFTVQCGFFFKDFVFNPRISWVFVVHVHTSHQPFISFLKMIYTYSINIENPKLIFSSTCMLKEANQDHES